MSAIKLIVIGASWGGLSALSKILSALPAGFAVPIVLVQHRAKHADNLLASLLQDCTSLPAFLVELRNPSLEDTCDSK